MQIMLATEDGDHEDKDRKKKKSKHKKDKKVSPGDVPLRRFTPPSLSEEG